MTTPQPSPRDRMVSSAAQLIGRHGVNATGIREVVEHARAPRGSVQHYFPGGKGQLVNEAVEFAGRSAGSRVERWMATAVRPTPAKLLAAMARQWTDELRANGFAAGSALTATAVDCAAEDDSTRTRLLEALTAWRVPLVAALAEMGVAKRRAPALATLMLSALEGAILLARIEASLQPLTAVVRELGPVLDAAVA